MKKTLLILLAVIFLQVFVQQAAFANKGKSKAKSVYDGLVIKACNPQKGQIIWTGGEMASPKLDRGFPPIPMVIVDRVGEPGIIYVRSVDIVKGKIGDDASPIQTSAYCENQWVANPLAGGDERVIEIWKEFAGRHEVGCPGNVRCMSEEEAAERN